MDGDERTKTEAAARQFWADAAGAYLRHSQLTTLDDDVSGASAWKAAELLDRAGETVAAIAAYERLTIQRPRDPRISEGMLALGRLYESAGMLDKAVEIFGRNVKENSRTPSSYASAVQLARCYVALGEQAQKPEDRSKNDALAESTLLAVVQDDTDLKPEAREFRESILALGDLYYGEGRWGDAILRFDELVRRYPQDAGLPHALFLLGQSYRKSAAEIADALKRDPAISNRGDLMQARGDRLRRAADDYGRVIGILDAPAMGEEPAVAGVSRALSALDRDNLRMAYTERAQCAFDLGDFENAVKLYQQAAARFPEETLAADAYVQIVNAYRQLKQPAEASAAAERGQWVLKRIPDAAFAGARPGGPDRGYYEKLLALSKG